MQKQTIQFVRSLILIPFLTAGSPFAMLQNFQAPVGARGEGSKLTFASLPSSVSEEIPSAETLSEEHAKKIDAYFAERDMPLEGHGAKMVSEAEKNNLDWRLLPAIAVKESTGGRFACGHNPFGWGSCRINNFKTWDHAIEVVARNLGGNNPVTREYYKGTTKEKLYSYNGSVIPAYTAEVMKFMELIENAE